MATLILFIAALIEMAFAIYCIYTRSNQKRIRNIMGIGIFVIFIVFQLVLGYKLNFRWRALAILLFLWAMVGGLRLIRDKADNKTYKLGRIVRKAISMVLLVFIALTPVFVFPEYKMIETTGEYKVERNLYTFLDNNRIETYTNTGDNRRLNVEFWYPVGTDETYPLIVFSHGSFGIRTSNESLYNQLASHGYVVASIDHTHQSLFTIDVEGNKTWIDMGYMKELKNQDAHLAKQQSYEYFQKWMGIRMGDIDFVINYVLAEAVKKDSDRVYKLVDKGKVGVMGHSLGGSAALGIGRGRDDIKAVIALEAPFMDDIIGVEDNEFIFTDEKYPAAVLNIYSDASWSHLSEWSQYEQNYNLLTDTAATAHNVYIQGVGHLTLTDLALTSPIITRILNQKKSERTAEYSLKTINKLSLEFFDCYLKGIGDFASDGVY